MIRSVLIGLLCLSHSMVIHAMQPVNVEGTSVSSAYFNSNIDVISETVTIDIAKHFRSARFTVKYEIYNKQASTQIPLLFALHDNERVTDSSNNSVPIRLTIDGKPLAMQTVASSENEMRFDDFFENYRIKPDSYTMRRGKGNTLPNHISFIQSELSVGYHTLVATYDAMPSYRDARELTYEYSYNYSFKPIKSKQSFTSTIINVGFDGAIEDINMEVFADGFQNLDETPHIDVSDNVISFEEKLPDTIHLRYQRQFPSWIESLIIWPILGSFILFYVLFSRWHIKSIKNASHTRPLSILWYVLAGSILVPLFSITFIVLNETLIYTAVGAQKIDDMRNFFGFFSYILLFLILAPFYSAFIYYKYYKKRDKTTAE